MLTYATLANLTRRASLNALAEAAAPNDGAVDGALLGLALAGADVSAYDAAAQAAVAEAVARLRHVLTDAAAEVDGYLAARYPDLTEAPAVLTVYCVDMALYRLLGGERGDTRQRRYQAALNYLVDVAQGKLDLAPTPTAATGGDIQIETGPRVFDEDTLATYR